MGANSSIATRSIPDYVDVYLKVDETTGYVNVLPFVNTTDNLLQLHKFVRDKDPTQPPIDLDEPCPYWPSVEVVNVNILT